MKQYNQSGGSLTRHKRTHTRRKPYTCDEPNCDYAEAQKSGLVERIPYLNKATKVIVAVADMNQHYSCIKKCYYYYYLKYKIT